MASTIGMDGDGNSMGATDGDMDCKGALCVSATVGGVDVDGLVGGTFSALFALGFAISFPLPRLGGPSYDIVNYFQ